jgi:hypothetical protein
MGLLAVLPFMTLEWATDSDLARSKFSLLLFGVMWVLASIFGFIALRMMRAPRARPIGASGWIGLGLRLSLLVLIAWFWVGLVVDQMPCFLGATGC